MKKTISLIMLFALCLSLCGCGTPSSKPEETDERLNYSILDSGACTSTIDWEIRSNNTLYIFGSGCTPNYSQRKEDGVIAPWLSSPMRQYIQDVYIGNGITGIGKYNFHDRILSSLRIGPDVVLWELQQLGRVSTVFIPSSLPHLRVLATDVNGYAKSTPVVYYEGSEEDWYSISKALSYMEVHFNSYK